ncbi:MAG: hypothetical protein GPJ54_04325 [Candidatus Heimdallarchaeota archaeon]|nr:hypothetical protein [Candidatus Heimdallarchaeota archaeon]
MDSLQILSFIVSIIFLFPGIMLYKQFKYTKINEYLIFSSFFILNFLFSLFVTITGIDFGSNFDGSETEKAYLLVIQIQIITNLIAWFTFFYLGYRIIWPNGNKLVISSFLTFGIAQLILVAFMKLDELPDKSQLLFINLNSQQTGKGAIIELFPDFYFGQGHVSIILIWNISCVLVFAYSYLRMKNPFSYLQFNKIRFLWLLFAACYLTSQLFILISLLGFELFLALGSLIQLIGIVGIIYVAISVPEGLLLNHVQLIKAVSIFDNLETDDKTVTFPLTKVFDYIEYMSQHIQMSTNMETKK